MAYLLHLLGAILLLPSLVSGAETTEKKRVDLIDNRDGSFMCGTSRISSKLEYCTVFKSCDTAGILEKFTEIDQAFSTDSEKTFAKCDKNINGQVQFRIRKDPDVWKNIVTINCMNDGRNTTVDFKFKGEKVAANTEEMERLHTLDFIDLRCISDGRARFDIYHYSERSNTTTTKDTEGVRQPGRIYVVYIFISLLAALTAMATYYVAYLYWENRQLLKYVTRKQSRHDELWLGIDRSERQPYDPEEIWNAMPLIHQQVAIEAALFLQKYKEKKFPTQLRQWIIDRGYPAGATEIILELAGLGDTEVPFYAPEERNEAFVKQHNTTYPSKLDLYADRIESRIVDTLNYANRLRRRKIVFTDHRWLELHHLFLELLLTSLGSPSHPTIHDAEIPVLPRHAFGTRDDPMEEEKEEREAAVRQRKPHFLHHDWDEAQRLLGSEA